MIIRFFNPFFIFKLIGNKVLNNPLVVHTVEQSKSYLDKYEKWQLVVISVSATYMGMKLYHFYIDIDTGNLMKNLSDPLLVSNI